MHSVAGWHASALLFGWAPLHLTQRPPDWLANPLNGNRMPAPERNWWEIPDFDTNVGDIKLIWELSRMDWVLSLAQRARQGDVESLKMLNTWLADWCVHNPPYRGPNWKCGQEASLRVLNLAVAAHILGQVGTAANGLRDLLHLHLSRIAPTVSYAMAQDNNHGTSEAAALYVGGSWLALLGVAEGAKWHQAGRRLLESRAARLIGADGTFSQYSLNYHRVMLDTYCIVEMWRRRMKLPNFSAALIEKLRAATNWLYEMIDPLAGDGPNVGANDGARLLQLTDADYRDFRPSVQLAEALFCEQLAYPQDGSFNHPLSWLNIPVPQALAPRHGNYLADDGGFGVLRRGAAMAMLRYPRFKFRPGQADALHLDLWVSGVNMLRDAGTYSYNIEPHLLQYFSGTASHNTVQFDNRDQMPHLGRFLFGDWLKTEWFEAITADNKTTRMRAGYRDSHGARHLRSVAIGSGFLRVTDEISGFRTRAVLRWRLLVGDWLVSKGSNYVELTLGTLRIRLNTDVPITACGLADGWESLYYQKKTALPVLELEVGKACTIVTQVEWVA
jgi:hypothetical protein